MDLGLDLSHLIPQLKEHRALWLRRKDEIQRRYDEAMDDVEGNLKHIDGLLKGYSKSLPSFASNDNKPAPTVSTSAPTEPPTATPATTPPPAPAQVATTPVQPAPAEAKPPRKKPGPPKGFRKGIPKKPRPEAVSAAPSKLKVDEVTTKEIVPSTPVKVDPVVTESIVPTAPKETPKAESAAPAPSVPPSSSLPPGVTLGRNGRPRILEAVAFVLKTYGPLHVKAIVEKLDEHDLLPNSKDPRAYVGFEMSKNKDIFRPVKSKKKKGVRGIWTLAPKYEAALAKLALDNKPSSIPAPAAGDDEVEVDEVEAVEASPPEEEETEEEEDVEVSDDSDLQDIRTFRASEANVSVTDDEAAKIVDEMTDPSRLNGTAAA